MAKMKDLYIDIEEMYIAGYTVDQIVKSTGAPLEWVLEILNCIRGETTQ